MNAIFDKKFELEQMIESIESTLDNPEIMIGSPRWEELLDQRNELFNQLNELDIQNGCLYD